MASLLWDVTWVLVGFLIIVTAIYLVQIDTCNGWCCSSSVMKGSSLRGSTLPYQQRQAEKPLHKFSREANGSANGSESGVMILENFYTGLTTLNVKHHPIYNVPRLAAELRPETEGSDHPTYLHKNKYPMVCLSGKKGTAQEIYMTAYLSQALAKPNAFLIINGMSNDSPAFQAWSQLVVNGIIHWKEEDLYQRDNEQWAVGKFKNIDTQKCVSSYLYDQMKEYIGLVEAKTVYYVISSERENELREAYRNDQEFSVHNTTSAFHAAVLKVLIPSLRITITSMDPVTSPAVSPTQEAEFYNRAVEFVRKYILGPELPASHL